MAARLRPDLNPVEMVWNHSKYSDLANFIPEDVDDLHQAVTTSLGKMRTQTSLLRSFFQYAGLELCCSFYSTKFNKLMVLESNLTKSSSSYPFIYLLGDVTLYPYLNFASEVLKVFKLLFKYYIKGHDAKMNKIACITGDVHHYIGDPNSEEKAWGRIEYRCAKEYSEVLESLGARGTLFVTGKCVDEHPDVFKEISKIEGIELGGHTYHALRFSPFLSSLEVRGVNFGALHHYIFYLLCGSFYGPRFYQKSDILKTIEAFKKIGVRIRSWRTHCYSGNSITFSILDELGFVAVSDRKGEEFNVSKEIGNLYQITVTGPTDGVVKPQSDNLEYRRKFWKFLARQIKKEKSMVLQLHPKRQKMLDEFNNLRKVITTLQKEGYELLTISEVIKRYINEEI